MSVEFPIKNLGGVNVKDAADKVKDNEFTQLQNVWQPSKGVLSRRFGSTIDQASFPLASRMSGIWRQYASNGERISLYHLVPNAALLPDNTVDLTLADVTSANGEIFGGGAVVTLYVCYSWIGCGIEQTYNSKNRAGFGGLVFPLDASANTAHQTITLASNTNILRVTVPAFPSGVRGANIFVARGTDTQMTYMGTVGSSAGQIDISSFIGPVGAKNDALDINTNVPIFGYNDPDGTLQNGVYYISGAWVCDANVQEGSQSFKSVPLYSGIAPLIPSFADSFSSVTSGSLSNTTNYDFKYSIVDKATGVESTVSNLGVVNTGTSTSIDVNIPFLPNSYSPGSTFNIYAGSHGGTLYLFTAGVTPSAPSAFVKVNVGTIPTSGVVAPSSKAPTGVSPYYTTVTLTGSQNAISVTAPASASSNGAKSIYVFLGTQSPQLHSMTCVGLIDVNAAFIPQNFINIKQIPSNNAQSTPNMVGAEINPPEFWNGVNDGNVGGVNYSMGSRFQSRFGFIMAYSTTWGLREVFPSRTLLLEMVKYIDRSVFSGDSINQPSQASLRDLHNFAPQPKTQNDLYKNAADMAYSQPFFYGQKPIDPLFCHHLGITYFSNGADIPWMTDGYSLGQLSCVQSASQTKLPPIPRYIFEYQNSLVVAGALAGNQIYQSNANAPQNWASNGSGSLNIFASIGDATGSGVTAFGIFTPATEATNNPNSFMVAFKKVGCWMINTISSPTASVLSGILGGQVPTTLTQVSGRVGCTAYRTVTQVPQGLMFLAQDSNVYLLNGVREPNKVGTKIQNLLAHLSQNDAWMQLCTASFHDNHFKLSYPSPAAVLLNPVVNDSELWADLRTSEGDPITWVGPHLGRNIGPQVVLVGDNDNLTRLVADGSVVRSYTADSRATLADLNSGGTSQAIAVKILSKIYRFNADNHAKRYMGALLDMYIDQSYSNTVLFTGQADQFYHQVNRQLSVGGAVWDSSQWDQSNYADAIWQGFSFLFGPDNLVGRTLQFGIQTNDQAPFVLAAIILMMEAEKRRVIN